MPEPTEPATPFPAWPSPPAGARVVYEGSLYSPLDLGVRRAVWTRVYQAITGSDRGREPWPHPFGISVDAVGNLCLADTEAGVVGFYDRERARFRRWDEVGEYRLVSPVSAVHVDETFFVADTGLDKILAFDEKGRIRYVIDGPFERPTGLAVAGTNLVVADAPGHQVLFFDLDGQFLRGFGQHGSAPGEFNRPTHVAADAHGRLFVTDAMNARVQVFDADGNFLRAIGSLGDTSGSLARPKGIAVDGEGRLFVVDALFDNVQIFDSEGRFLLHVGRRGSEPGEFWLPAGIAVGSDRRIYVADSYNHRIQVFRYLGEPEHPVE